MKKIMHLATIVFFLLTLLFVVFYHRFDSSAALTLSITCATVAYHFAMRLAVGLVFQIWMRNKADYNKKWYQPKKWEDKLYQKLHVRQWKGGMPAYDSSLFDPKVHPWDEIAQAMCQAELVHETIVILSFLPVVATIWFGAFFVFLITSLGAAVFDLMFVIMQRYNRPRVVRLAKRGKKL